MKTQNHKTYARTTSSRSGGTDTHSEPRIHDIQQGNGLSAKNLDSGIPAHGFDNYESACDATLSRSRAIAEVQRHALNVDEFLSEVGDKPAYTGKEVLDWLGY